MSTLRKTTILLLVIVFVFSGIAYSQKVQQIRLKADSTKFMVTKDAERKDVLVINTSISFLNTKAVETKGGEFINLDAKGLMKVFGKGEPNLPVFSKLIQVPLDAKVDFEILRYDEEVVDLQDHSILQKIVPAQPSRSKTEEIPFYYDSLAYTTDEYADPGVAVFEDLGIMRNVRLVRVQIHPIRYNPVQNKLKIMNNMQVEIKFTGGDDAKTKSMMEKYSSAMFNEVIARAVSNLQFEFKPVIEDVTYVIVSDRMFELLVNPFKQWKEALGFHVITGYTDDPAVGNTTTSIKNWLEDLYNNPPPGVNPPHYVLLVGDTGQIPAFDGTTTGDHPTDLYYCEYSNDALPEVFYGRFSANDLIQLQSQVNKTMMYEQHTWPDPSYMMNAVLVAGADAAHATTYGNGQINYGTDQYFNTAHGFTAHAYLQPEPAGGDYSTHIKNNISDGVGFANYTAHCDPTGWFDPSFHVADIAALASNHKVGLWVGNCCRSNRFSVPECFGEAALRAPEKGAVGYIGATDYTYWDEDFWWAVGFKNVVVHPPYDAAHLGTFDRLFHTHGEPEADWYPTQGQMVFAGNLAVNESTSYRKNYYWEVYELMGDPSVEIRTKLPQTKDVIHAATAPLINNNFVVAVKKGGTNTMLPDATVTLIKDNAVVDSKKTADAYPDKGTAKFSYNLTSGPMTICVTKSNYIPYMGTCTLVPGFGPELWISLHGGATLPYEDWYEDATCFNYIVNLEYHFALRWAFVLEVAYNDFRWIDPDPDDDRFPWWNISPTIRYYLPLRKVKPFINCGPGFYMPDEGDNRFGFKVGLGVDYPITDKIRIEVGTDYHHILADEEVMYHQDKKTAFQHFHTGLTFMLWKKGR